MVNRDQKGQGAAQSLRQQEPAPPSGHLLWGLPSPHMEEEARSTVGSGVGRQEVHCHVEPSMISRDSEKQMLQGSSPHTLKSLSPTVLLEKLRACTPCPHPVLYRGACRYPTEGSGAAVVYARPPVWNTLAVPLMWRKPQQKWLGLVHLGIHPTELCSPWSPQLPFHLIQHPYLNTIGSLPSSSCSSCT